MLTAAAQTEKGRFTLDLSNFSSVGLLTGNQPLFAPTNGLGIAFGTQRFKADGKLLEPKVSLTSLALSLDGHYFLVNNFSAGLGLHLFTQSMKEDKGETYKATLLMAGPRLRYFIPIQDRMKTYIRGGLSLGSTWENEDDSEATELVEFPVGSGVYYFPTDRMAVNIGLSYGSIQYRSSIEGFDENIDLVDTRSGVVIDVGFGLFF